MLRFLHHVCKLLTLKCEFLHVDKTLGADITLKNIRKLCTFRKVDKICMLILVCMEL